MTETTQSPPRSSFWWITGLVLLFLVGGGAVLWSTSLLPRLRSVLVRGDETPPNDDDHDSGHSHGEHDSTTLDITSQAQLNLGLTPEFIQPVQLRTFRRTIALPAVVVDRPGRTHLHVSTPLTGVIQHVHAVSGEAVQPGDILFEIRLTHEDLVQTQTDFLKTLGELDVEDREVQRLQGVAESGAISGRTLLERKYSQEKLRALLKAQWEALKLHGLSERQIEEIRDHRHLLRELQIAAPGPDVHHEDEELLLSDGEFHKVPPPPPADSILLVIEELSAHKGQSVSAGAPLCTLADYSRLYIEGKAFEQDADTLYRCVEKGWPVTAVFPGAGGPKEVPGLRINHLANSVDTESRTLSFFVDLPNEVIRDERNQDGQRFVSWKYRIGQQLQVLAPVEEWTDQLVVPVEAVAREGASSYVFRKMRDGFRRVEVHVKYRDQHQAVISSDGDLKAGHVIAMRAAHQLQMALQNQNSGPVDPHAGHHH